MRPISLVDSGGIPITEAENGEPMTPVDAPLYGEPMTLVDSGGIPVVLVYDDLSPYGLWSVESTTIAEAGSGVGGAGQWRPSNAGVQTMTIDSDFVRRPGHPTLKIDASVLSPTGAYYRSFRKAIEATALTGAYEMWIWVPVTTAGGHSFLVKAGSDTPADPPIATPANLVQQQFVPDKYQACYWTCLYWHTDGKIYANAAPNGVAPSVTGTPDLNSIKEIEFDWSINIDTPAAERYMYLDLVAFNGKSKPKIIIGFDGFGDSSHAAIVKPKFDEVGMVGYIAGDGDSLAGNEAAVSAFNDAGWDIISQGIGHKNYVTNVGDLSADFDTAKAILQAAGFTRALDYFAYPFNTRDLATDAILEGKGVKWARTTGGNRFPATSLGKPEPLVFGALDMGQKTAAQMLAWVDDAILAGYSMALYGHTITTTASTSTETATAEFEAFMDGLATRRDAGQIEVTTPSRQSALWR